MPKEEQTCAVLTTGSFSAYVNFLSCIHPRNNKPSSWKALFFYRCTRVIAFAPLKSQGPDARSNYIRERKGTVTPPPCSPKSIYVLASLVKKKTPSGASSTTLTHKLKLGIQPLCDSAFADIKSKVSANNVVGEMFSRVTARCETYDQMVELQDQHPTCSFSQEKIMDMQCDLLISNFKNPKTIALVKENIGYASNGSSPHGAIALKLGFKKAFEVKKQQRGVQLRCSNTGCEWSRISVLYSSIGSSIRCPKCSPGCSCCGTYLQCVGCGSQRTSNCASCQGCGKKFL